MATAPPERTSEITLAVTSSPTFAFFESIDFDNSTGTTAPPSAAAADDELVCAVPAVAGAVACVAVFAPALPLVEVCAKATLNNAQPKMKPLNSLIDFPK